MSKKVTYISKDKRIQEIISKIEGLGYTHGISTVFEDFITIVACAISNSFDKVHFDEREALYMQTIKKYSRVIFLFCKCCLQSFQYESRTISVRYCFFD